MPSFIDDVREALADILQAEQVSDVRESKGKVIVTIATDIPMPEKPSFANKVKERVGRLNGVESVLVHFEAPAQPAAEPAQAKDNPIEKVKNIVAVGAGKGGVGKSTIAVNLAVALANEGHKVGLLDADIYGPSAAIMTGTQNHKAQGDENQRVVPPLKFGVKIISVAFLIPSEKSAIVWRGPMVGKMVNQLLFGVAWGELDYLIVDLPPGTGDAVLSLAQSVPLTGAIVVTTPQDVALIDVLKAIEMFRSVKVPVTGIVENMAGFTCAHCGETTPIFLAGAGKKAAAQYGLPLLGSLALDAEIPVGGDSGKPIVIEKPDSQSARAFAEIARSVVGLIEAKKAGPTRIDIDWQSGV